MKKRPIVLFIAICIIAALTGCGTNFTVSNAELSDYAENHEGIFADITSDYSEVTQIEGCYIAEADGVHVELWDFDSTDSAGSWFSDNLEDLKEAYSNYTGSTSSSSGDYSFFTDGKFYHLMYCNDLGIWAEGSDKEAVNKVLIDLGIIKK